MSMSLAILITFTVTAALLTAGVAYWVKRQNAGRGFSMDGRRLVPPAPASDLDDGDRGGEQ